MSEQENNVPVQEELGETSAPVTVEPTEEITAPAEPEATVMESNKGEDLSEEDHAITSETGKPEELGVVSAEVITDHIVSNGDGTKNVYLSSQKINLLYSDSENLPMFGAGKKYKVTIEELS